MKISEPLQNTARYMLHELESTRLTVVLTPDWYGSRHRRLRTVDQVNPAWYRQLCNAYPANRQRPRTRKKPDTAIKRRHTLRALAELASGHCTTEYAHRLLPYVQAEADTALFHLVEDPEPHPHPFNLQLLALI